MVCGPGPTRFTAAVPVHTSVLALRTRITGAPLTCTVGLKLEPVTATTDTTMLSVDDRCIGYSR